MGRLLGNRVYLAGAIDRAADSGRTWRQRITPELTRRGIVVYDPLDKPIAGALEDEASREVRSNLRDDETWEACRLEMKQIRAIDMGMVNRVDFLIVHLDLGVHACGTYEEIKQANDQKKPVLIFCEQGKKSVPLWLFGQIPHQFFFDDMDSLLRYVDHVNDDPEVDHLRRWLFFDVKKVYPSNVIGLIKDRVGGIH